MENRFPSATIGVSALPELRRSNKPLVQVPPLPQCEVCVIVPVRNEAETLEQTLTALASQVELDEQRFHPDRYEVILFANNCSDDSAAIGLEFARTHPHLVLHVVAQTLPASEAYIGRVRQLLMDEAYRRFLYLKRPRGIIASTDGDSQVSATWIAAIRYEIKQGADAVGGRILSDLRGRADLDRYTRTCYLREVGYQFLISELEAYLDPDPFDPLPRHFQHYGASLAVTAEMYALAGGMPPVHTPEDVAFYQALRRVNAHFRHSPLVRVTTSTRQTGRAPQGLANQLAQWKKMGQHQQCFLVEPAQAWITRFRARNQLRQLWLRKLNGYLVTFADVAPIAQSLSLCPQWLIGQLSQPHPFGVLAEQVEQRQQQQGGWQKRWSLLPIEQTIADLRLVVDQLRREKATSDTYRTAIADQLRIAPASCLPSIVSQENHICLEIEAKYFCLPHD
ncbi:MAG: glycosyltransferase [Scytolyngbya sp. HA4215-MV1]|nr:glycosyltransferase [Scytolyngbya sp. HA4215-MV1]